MYQSLTKKLSHIFSSVSSKVSEQDITRALDEITQALIHADVSTEAITTFNAQLKQQTKDLSRVKKLDAKSQLMQMVRSALLSLLSSDAPLPSFQHQNLTIIMLVGLQGAGKTTTCGKLATWIKQHTPTKNVMMASVDIYRPQAIKQLEIIANQTQSTFYQGQGEPLAICQQAIKAAKQSNIDTLIIDTAGRLDIDEERMQELRDIHRTIKPHYVFYTVDSMMGQSALSVAKHFAEVIDLSGIILTKVDSDTKGGAALSVKSVINKPIFWMGIGEDLSKLEAFDPERITDQLLDMGDIIGLAKKASQHMDMAKTEALSKRLQKGQFTFEDMQTQIEQISQLGGLGSIMKMLPGAAKLPDHVMKMIENDDQLKKVESLIQSMTPQERLMPELVRNNKKRQQRIFQGAGRDKRDINELIKAYDKMKKMTEKLKGGKMKALMQQFMNQGDSSLF